MIIEQLEKLKLIHPPHWLSSNTMYLTQMGSSAYGVSTGSSDIDVYGVCLPPKGICFPHLDGYIEGFSNNIPRFDQWQEHHVVKDDKHEYDFSVFNLIKYFKLCMDNNPNMIDSLFSPRNCIMHITLAFEHVRESRHIFLHKGCYQKLKGYAFSQLHKMKSKDYKEEVDRIRDFELFHNIPFETTFKQLEAHIVKRREMNVDKSEVANNSGLLETKEFEVRDPLFQLSDKDLNDYSIIYSDGMKKSKRFEDRKIRQFDTKYAYHLVRLLSQCEQILVEEDLCLNVKTRREHMKAVRNGEVTESELMNWFHAKEITLEELYRKSTLRQKPDEDLIKQLLIDTLENHYGNLSAVIGNRDRSTTVLKQIKAILASNEDIFN